MAKNFWDENAEQWAKVVESRAIASRAVTSPAILSAVLERQPRSVLDLGCGEGWMAPEFLSRKIQYLGFDGSSQLVQIARAKHGPHFEHRDYENLIENGANPVDAVVLNYALMGDDLIPLFRAIKKMLNPKGSIVIQTLHPCFALKPYRDGWQSEDFKSLSTPFQGAMPWYGRTLSSWVKIFHDCGLQLEKMVEPAGPDGPISLIFVLTDISTE